MKNFFLGFFAGLSLCLTVYVIWEHYRHVPVVIQQIPVPVQPQQQQFPFNKMTEK